MVRLSVWERGSFRRVLQAFAHRTDPVQFLWRPEGFWVYSDVMNVSFEPPFFDYYVCDSPTSITITARSCRRLARVWDANQVLTLELLPPGDCVRFVLEPHGGGPPHQGQLRAVGSSGPAGPQ